jgi:NTP pyrophosphatase (non-canonical NTP hydrolase)
VEFEALIDRALEIRRQYADLEPKTYGRSWTGEELALGFVGDVGDLVKLVMAASGVRHIPDARQKLAHELADCLWSIIVLADVFDVNLEQAFLQTMDELERYIALSPGGEEEFRGKSQSESEICPV